MPKNLSQKQIIILGGAVVIVLIVGVLVVLNLRTNSSAQQVTLTIWGTDNTKTMDDVINAFEATNKSAQITYTQIDPSQYDNKLLSALAAGTGPDIFEIGDHDVTKWRSVLTPIPTTLPYNLVSLENDFPTVVSQDFVSNGGIYALPFSIDTLAMIYNKDLFDSAGIAVAPKTWDDVQADIARLRSVNDQGQLTQAAAAIGGSEASIANAPDSLYLLMLQNGTKMVSDDLTSAVFASGGGNVTNSGISAFNFYLQFANATSPYYTWNDSMGDSLNSFIQGKTAILFDYQASLATIKAKAPFLNVGVAPMPQPTGATITINYPNYTGWAVSKAGRSLSAWDFLLAMTTSPQYAATYINDTGAPPALRTSIQADLGDPSLAVFASQALTARSWYEADSGKIDGIINTAIQSVLNGSADSTSALNTAQQSVDQVMSGR